MGSVSPQEEHSAAFVEGGYSAPMSSEHNFEDQYDHEDPNRAMSDYARYDCIMYRNVILLTHGQNYARTHQTTVKRSDQFFTTEISGCDIWEHQLCQFYGLVSM
jgi:hypothetical protein